VFSYGLDAVAAPSSSTSDRYCNPERDLSPSLWQVGAVTHHRCGAGTLGSAAEQSYGLASQASGRGAGIPGGIPGVRTFRSPNLMLLPTPDCYSTDSDPRDSGEPPPLHIFNHWVVTVHRLASQARCLLGRDLAAGRSLGCRHHMAHKKSCLAPSTPLTLAFGNKARSPPPPHLCNSH